MTFTTTGKTWILTVERNDENGEEDDTYTAVIKEGTHQEVSAFVRALISAHATFSLYEVGS
jgi:hypothetical protein